MNKIRLEYTGLMSVYKKENEKYLDEALSSIYHQTIRPKEFVLIKDGPVGKELNNVILKYASLFKKIDIPFIILSNDHNLGLALSLNKGILNSTYPFIARFDSDDINCLDRMEKTATVFQREKSLDVVGSWISEFSTTTDEIKSIRRVPESQNKIVKFSKHRNPMNHMSVTFKKKLVVQVKNYENITSFEDYYLWLKMLNHGMNFKNIQQTLVYARVNDDFINRRSGFKYLKNELKFQTRVYLEGYISFFNFIYNVFTRCWVRLLPSKMVERMYKLMRAGS